MAIDFEKEAEAGTETVTRKTNSPPPKGLIALAVLGAVGMLGWSAYKEFFKQTAPPNREEKFNLAQNTPPPDFDRLTGKTAARNKMVMAPPAPPPPAPVVDDGEAKRRAEEEERRRREAQRAEEALRSPMLIVDGQQVAAREEGDSAGDSNTLKTSAPDEDANRRFLDSASAGDVQRVRATQTARIDALIPQGATIRATLETAVQSDLPGMVRAITTEDAYSFDGRRVLLPKGTMLTGEYRSVLALGQTRVFMVWTRALRHDGVSILLGSGGTDALGRAGVTGDVDRHWLERFGAATMLSIVGGGSAYLSGLGQPSTASTTSGMTPQQMAQMQASQTIAQTYAEMANTTLKEEMAIPPTIFIDQGTPVIVLVRRDLDFARFYPDPVKEALRELKRPGSTQPTTGEPQPTLPPPNPVVTTTSTMRTKD
jgi:type IV secretion system protein VirB10